MLPIQHRSRALTLVAAGALLTGGLFAAAPAPASPSGSPSSAAAVPGKHQDGYDNYSDDIKHPLKIKAKRDAQKQAALQRILKGKKPFKSNDKSKQVPLELEGTDRIFVVLVEFGDLRNPNFCDSTEAGSCPFPSDGTPQRYDGPLRNQIPEPDRAVDNSTLWQADYNRDHYEDMYFNRMADYYERQSSGRYTVDGDVTEWVKVPFNEATYGRNYCGSIVCATSRALVRDALAMWVEGQLDAGQTMAQIQDYLKTFDYQDRYDLDGDGNFREPDGFIDHFQIVHAGGDEASADPTFGTDAIWSHRSYANLQGSGPGGLAGVNVGSNAGLISSAEVPNNPTGIWVGDYTVQPENGGLGVFAHEYAHDLGLPDLYDTSGNTGGAENNTAFWTLMSSGANIGNGAPDGIGDSPTDMGAWELFQLGWLDAQGDKGPFYEIAEAGKRSQHQLATNVPGSSNGAQAVFTVLPDSERDFEVGAPAAGGWMWWSSAGNDLNTTMTKTGITGTALSAQVSFNTEEEYDYGFLEASSDGGATWRTVTNSLSDAPGHAGHDPDGNNPDGTGFTGSTDGEYVTLTATLPPGTNAIRFRYQTDPAVEGDGILIDEISIDGVVIGSAETETEGWTLDGFVRSDGVETRQFFNAYVAENRQYDGDDVALKTAYNFSFGTTKPDWVENYPYQNGLLISYWNEAYGDNNVGDHPGKGLILPVDSHPQFTHWTDNTLMRNRILSFDSTFGHEATDPITLSREVMVDGVLQTQTVTIPSRAGVSRFDDTQTWWFNSDAHGATGAHAGRYQPGWYSVDVPKTGTTISVIPGSRKGVLKIEVAPK